LHDVILQVTLGSIMFGIGITLKFRDFYKLALRPKPIFLGLVLQMIFLPLLTFGVLMAVDISPFWKAGIMIVSLCPGGASSNFITHLLDLNTALSVSLTIVNSFIILVSVPLGIAFTMNYFLADFVDVEISLLEPFLNVILVIFLPTILGMIFEKICPVFAKKLVKPFKIINVILLGATIVMKSLLSDGNDSTAVNIPDSLVLIPILLFIHLFSMIGSGYLASKITDSSSGITIGIEVGLQNTILALLVVSYFDDAIEMSKPALVLSIFSFMTTIVYGYLGRRILLPKKGRSVNI